MTSIQGVPVISLAAHQFCSVKSGFFKSSHGFQIVGVTPTGNVFGGVSGVNPIKKALKLRKIVIPITEGLRWRTDANWIFQEKLDGCFDVRQAGRWIIAGERMKDGRFFGFDCVGVDGMDVRKWPLRARLRELQAAVINFPDDVLPVPTGNGGEFLEAVLDRGGEGIVAKRLDFGYGLMLAAKVEKYPSRSLRQGRQQTTH